MSGVLLTPVLLQTLDIADAGDYARYRGLLQIPGGYC